MKIFLSAALLLLLPVMATQAAAEPLKKLAEGLKNPESVCVGPGGHLYVTEIGEFNTDGDGQITVIRDGKAEVFVKGLNDPKGIVAYRNNLYVTDKDRIIQVDAQGQTTVFAEPSAFPKTPLFLNDIAVDVPGGSFLVTDSGDGKGSGGAVYQINIRRNRIETVADTSTIPGLNRPNGVAFDGASQFILADMGTGNLYRVNLTTRAAQKIAEGLEGADGLVWDHFGRFFVTSWTTGKVTGIPRPGQKPVVMVDQGPLQSAADACLAPSGRELLVPDMKAGILYSVSTTIPGWEVDESPLPIEVVQAFPNLKWSGWEGESDTGRPHELRPILLTHAGDGSNLLYVPTQHGVIHTFPNDDKATETKVFMDISDRVRYSDRQNEEGFLGMAFHPKFKDNGEFFVFYTDVNAKMANVVSRFRVKSDDPTVGDPASEEEIIRFEKPFWNHDGGTIVFGPDGYLYVTHGDGGSGGDPHENGQNRGTLLGAVLRLDIDNKADGKNYAIPADNPFVNDAEARPEIWAYGLRNIWRMAFDPVTKELWAADVGQNLFEEINILTAGGNYGWNLREGLHPFGPKGVDVRDDLIDPLWEYHHDIGLSITGGLVYRGQKIPELQGAYLYGDYVSTRLWALRYDPRQGRVVANHPIESPGLAVMSFGEDADGEVYLLRASNRNQGIYRIVPKAK